MENPIRNLGVTNVPVRLHPKVTGSLKVWVKEGIINGRSTDKRILPHSIEAEQSVIGSMILDRDAILVASRS